MSYLFPTYLRSKLEWDKALGCRVTMTNGETFLDLTSGIGVANLGHSNPEVKAALEHQLDHVWHESNLFTNSLQESAGKKLAGGKDYVAFFCSTGTEANEAALKLARKATGKTDFITFENGFHGRTYGGMSATAQEKIQKGFKPMVPGFRYVPYNDLEAVKNALTPNTAGILLEVIQGEGGVLPADPGFLQAIAALCKEHDVLLMIDEVQTGMGRTGKMFAFENYGLSPDIFTLAKGLGNGVPVGAMLGKTKLKDAFSPGSHGTTFGGNPLVMAAANKVLDLMTPELFAAVQKKGAWLKDQLEKLHVEFPELIKGVRGIGLMLGIECNDPEVLKQLQMLLEKDHVLTLSAGKETLRLLPPLTIDQEELETAVAKLKKAFQELNA